MGMMLYFLIEPLSWFAVIVLLIIMIVLYIRLSQQLAKLRHNMARLQDELQHHKDNFRTFESSHSAPEAATLSSISKPAPTLEKSGLLSSTILTSNSETVSHNAVIDTELVNTESEDDNQANKLSEPISSSSLDITLHKESSKHKQSRKTASQAKNKTPASPIEPDERSLPIVTSLFNSIENWFVGGNLVVRVGVLVLLIGVVLLLRLLSEYIEIPIQFKLTAIVVTGLGLAGLGLKLASRRFAYGITLQGTGLAIAYLSTFFAYSVYHVISNLPSFIALGILSAVTVGLAVRQNAFPLALLALSGGFFAPILTSSDTDSLTVLFSYYLLLNVTIAAIAHYRPWKMLNLLGVTVTFGLAYYWGVTENLTTVMETQRWSLVLLVALHLLLYLFVVIRYAQQIIAYNAVNKTETNSVNQHDFAISSYLFPIDIGLLFSVPLLAFGLFSALLDGITHALTLTSAILAAIYLGLGWLFIQRSQRYALITEGMLALGGGFLALIIPLAFDAEWVAFGWSVQGLALVWFGRRSLRAWSVMFRLLLQLISIGMLLITLALSIHDYPTLALTVSAISYLATMFILRASNSPINSSRTLGHTSNNPIVNNALPEYATASGVSSQAAQQWLASINSQSAVFNIVWRSSIFMHFLTFSAIGWLLLTLIIDFNQWFTSWHLTTSTLLALAALVSLTMYCVINKYRSWREIRQFSHGLLLAFYLMLVLQLSQKFELDYQWTTLHWALFITLLVGWLVIGQLWLKTWHSHSNLSRYNSASWLGTGIL